MKVIIFTLLILSLSYTNVHAVVCVDRTTSKVDPSQAAPCPADTHISVATIKDFEVIFANVVSVAGILLGFSFFVMLIIGGVRYMLSGGDPKALQAAKGTITWAIIGLVLFALSYTILLIIQIFTGINVTIFRITI